MWEKVAEKIQESGKSNKGLKKIIGDWAKAVATKHHTMVREGKISHNQAHWSYKLAQKLIFRYKEVFKNFYPYVPIYILCAFNIFILAKFMKH